MEVELMTILNSFGFPAFVTAILLYDKIKSNGSLKRSVDNNTQLLQLIAQRFK